MPCRRRSRAGCDTHSPRRPRRALALFRGRCGRRTVPGMRRLLVPLALLASLLAIPAHPAAAAGTTVLDATFSSPANGWAKVERYHDTDASIPTEAYPPDGRGDQEGLRLTYFNNVLRP